MIDQVKQRLRGQPVSPELENLAEAINREMSPTITEIRQRFNEYLDALNPGDIVATAGAGPTEYLEVTIGGLEYSLALYPRG